MEEKIMEEKIMEKNFVIFVEKHFGNGASKLKILRINMMRK